jgi:putative ABC transport system substrate-binding protein
MRRRDFIRVITASAAAWPLSARAQHSGEMRRIGVLLNWRSDNREALAGIAAFKQVLQQGGWSEGANIRIDERWCEDSVERERRYAAELVALTPDVILAATTPSVVAPQSINKTLPIVFVSVSDPVRVGVVESLAHPGGNITGFMNAEYSLSTKWLGLLKEIAPSLVRASVLRDVSNPAGINQFSAIQGVAQPLGIEVFAINIHDAGEIERAVTDFSRLPNGGLIVTPTAGQSIHRDLIITLAARLKLPAVYADPEVVAAGGLISYGPDRVDQFRRAAGYVDRILKGEKPSDLPVQAPTKYELVINLKTAKALGITIPLSLLTTADQVIE